jgi:outer membrane protein OmpA-like peptidoglycan-associated protein
MYKVFRQTLPLFKTLAVLVLAAHSGPLFAQTADKIEALLNSQAVSWLAAVQFALEASEKAVIADPAEAFRFAAEKKWLPKKAVPEGTARLDGISLLLAQAFGIKGGLMYSLTKSSHHAYRELVYRNIIQGKTDPAMAVSGEELLFMVGKLLSMKEAEADALHKKEAAQFMAVQERLAQEINTRLAASNMQNLSAHVTESGVMINLPNIQFMMNSAVLTDSAREILREVGRILETISARNILVAGHVALAGTRAEQQRTSIDRARSVANYLVMQAARNTDEIIVRGYGADRPVADNNTEEGMEKNRRVEIIILTLEAMEKPE